MALTGHSVHALVSNSIIGIILAAQESTTAGVSVTDE